MANSTLAPGVWPGASHGPVVRKPEPRAILVRFEAGTAFAFASRCTGDSSGIPIPVVVHSPRSVRRPEPVIFIEPGLVWPGLVFIEFVSRFLSCQLSSLCLR